MRILLFRLQFHLISLYLLRWYLRIRPLFTYFAGLLIFQITRENLYAMGLCKTLYNHVYQFWSKDEYINWHHSVNSCPIFIVFFLFCWYFQAAYIYCKNEAENQVENFGLNPLYPVFLFQFLPGATKKVHFGTRGRVGGLDHFFLMVFLLNCFNRWMQIKKRRKTKKRSSKSD